MMHPTAAQAGLLDRLAGDFLALAGVVDVGGVDEVDARFERATMRWASSASVRLPKVMVPMQSGLTRTPVRPR